MLKPLKTPSFQDHSQKPLDKYTEYRTDLMKYLMNYSKMNDEEKNTFIEDVITSKDLQKLIFQEGMISYVDEVGGIPKIILTVLCKYLKHKQLNGFETI